MGYSASEIYNPTLDLWSATVPVGPRRVLHTATLLTITRVLVAGGFSYDGDPLFYLATAEVYDPIRQPRTPSTPQVSCGTSDGRWYRPGAWPIPCPARDPQSGLANASIWISI